MSKRIIFVCTGNTCRSPLAESYAKTKYEDHSFASRGIMVTDSTTNPYSQQIIDEEELVQPGEPQQLTSEIAETSILLTMTEGHLHILKNQYPDAEAYLLSEYADDTNEDISDPIGGRYEDYKKVYTQLKNFIDNMFK